MRTHTALLPSLSAVLLISAAVIGPPRAAHAFAEDVCYAIGGGPVQSCLPLPDVCRPVGTTNVLCKAAMVRAVAQQRNNADGGRSSVHTDVTNLLAQAVGFPATDAYWIAAYDEATDLNSFTPRDNNSMPVGDGGLTTATIDGVVRTDLASGGVLLHFVATYNNGSTTPVPGLDGLHPDPTDASIEVTLANFRAWAMAPSSAAKPACVGGLTMQSPDGDYATGSSCFTTGAPINGAISLAGPIDLRLATQAGPQLIQNATPPIFASGFDALVANDGAHDPSAAHAADARTGVYLHILADRISHHVCGDRSVISGPSSSGFFVDLGDSECNQPIHFLRHAWETGVPFAKLAPQDRTSIAVLSSVYDELVEFARARGVLRAGADSAAAKASFVVPLTQALEQFDAIDRVNAINAVGCAHGLVPLPGQTACTSPLYRM